MLSVKFEMLTADWETLKGTIHLFQIAEEKINRSYLFSFDAFHYEFIKV